MAWLQKRPQVSDPVNYYTLGLNKAILLVGLGNPGKEYNQTRHNIGFVCLDEFVKKNDEMSDWINKKDLKCQLSSGRLADVKVYAIKPTTFMNLSGEAVELISRFYNIHPDNIVVVHDELDINFGQIRLRKGGSSAGHNGIKSVTKTIGEDYNRIRVGIGPKQPESISSEQFVLKKFSKEEQEQIPNLTKEVNAVASEFIYGGNLPHETRYFLV